MATSSGTRGVTQMDVAQLMEQAYARASGGLANMISGEQLVMMKQSLFLILTAFVNKGLNLWCVATDTLPVNPGQLIYFMPTGAIDILNMQLRRGTFTDATSIVVGSATIDYGTSAARVGSVEVTLPAAGTYLLLLESSGDNINWTPVGSKTFTVLGEETVALDATDQDTLQYWRVSHIGVAPTTFIRARFVNAAYEIPMAQVSRDDYMNLPDKGAPGIPLQFWYDKQYATPRISVWQVSNSNQYQIVVTTQKEVEDVGALTNILAVPSRWLGAVISELAVRTYLVLPKAARTDVSLADLRQLAKDDLSEAADSETDGGPITFTPNIAGYQR